MQEYIVKFHYAFDECYVHKLYGIEENGKLYLLRDQNVGSINIVDVIKGYKNITRTTFELYDKKFNYSNKDGTSNW